MDPKFHALPPQKRLRLIHQQQQEQEQQQPSLPFSCLPAKKRKETRDPPVFPSSADESSYSLPAKKRVWALPPDLIPQKPQFDLNADYKEEEQQEEEKEEKEFNVGNEAEEEEEEDDGIVCAVCQSTDGDPSDPIVLCDGCDLMVHVSCYGSPLTQGIPDGDWFCAQCKEKKASSEKSDVSFSCCLCPVKGGAMKPTGENDKWAHVVCALFVPEVFFRDPEGREGVDCSKVPESRRERKCYLCKTTDGCAIDCSEPKCRLSFHVTCGLNEDLCIEYREGKKKGAVVAGFCRTHTDLWKRVSFLFYFYSMEITLLVRHF